MTTAPTVILILSPNSASPLRPASAGCPLIVEMGDLLIQHRDQLVVALAAKHRRIFRPPGCKLADAPFKEDVDNLPPLIARPHQIVQRDGLAIALYKPGADKLHVLPLRIDAEDLEALARIAVEPVGVGGYREPREGVRQPLLLRFAKLFPVASGGVLGHEA